MAVESRFVVIRQGVEVQTFMDKKGADEYDKMLDVADSLALMFEQAPVELSETVIEELSVYLAQNRDDVLVALQAKKAKPEAAKAKAVVKDSPEAASAKTASPKAKAPGRAKKSASADETTKAK